MKKFLPLALLLSLLLFANEKDQRPTVEQLFSVKTVQVKKIKTSHKKQNYIK